MPADSTLTGLRVQLSSNQSYTFIAAAVLKNDIDMDKLFKDILTQPEQTEPATEPGTTEQPTEPTNPETSDSGISVVLLLVVLSFASALLIKRRQGSTRGVQA